MKTIHLATDSISLTALLAEARTQTLILCTADGVEFILAEIDNFDREIELARKNPELMAFLDERGQQTKTISTADAHARLGLT